MRVPRRVSARWPAWLAVAVLTGLAGGLLIAATAGARRTDTALARHMVEYRFPHLRVGASDLYDQFRALPEVEATSESLTLAFAARDARNQPVLSFGRRAMAVDVSVDGRDGRGARSGGSSWPEGLQTRAGGTRRSSTRGRRGRSAWSRGTRSLCASSNVAQVVNLRGDPETMRGGRPVKFRVVGIKAATDTVGLSGRRRPADACLLHGARVRPVHRYLALDPTQAWSRRHRPRSGRGGADHREIHTSARSRDPPARSSARFTCRCRRSGSRRLRRRAGLRAARRRRSCVWPPAALDHPTLRALGMTRRQLLAVGWRERARSRCSAPRSPSVSRWRSRRSLRSAWPGSSTRSRRRVRSAHRRAGARGSARRDSARGRARLAGEPASAANATLLLRSPAGSGMAEALARWGLPATVVAGVRLALARGRGATAVPVGANAPRRGVRPLRSPSPRSPSRRASSTCSRRRGSSGRHGIRSPVLQPCRSPGDRSRRPRGPFDQRARVRRAGLGSVDVNGGWGTGGSLGVRAMDDLKGRLPPAVLEGRAPQRTGRDPARARRRWTSSASGSATTRGSCFETARMRIVGRGPVATGTTAPRRGAAMTFRSASRVAPEIPADCCAQVQARFVPGADPNQRSQRSRTSLSFRLQALPTTVADFGGVDELPLVLSALLRRDCRRGARAHAPDGDPPPPA